METGRIRELWEAGNDKYNDAEKIGTTYQTMYNIVYRGRPFKVDLLERIAKYYGVTVGSLFGEPTAEEKDKEIERLKAQIEVLQDTITKKEQ